MEETFISHGAYQDVRAQVSDGSDRRVVPLRPHQVIEEFQAPFLLLQHKASISARPIGHAMLQGMLLIPPSICPIGPCDLPFSQPT